MIRVVVAEDHNLVRSGICKLIEETDDLRIVGEADNGKDALKLVNLLHPDVLLLDLSMPQMTGLQVLAQIKSGTHVVVLSMHADLSIVQQALQKGAIGYILKQSMTSELLTAVRAASNGSVYLSSGVSQVLRHSLFGERAPNLLDRLSPREFQVVGLIVDGLSTREIADKLHSSVKTVEKQRRDAMRKLEVENIASLVRVTMELGLAKKQDSAVEVHGEHTPLEYG
ncbi:MAG: response regulator transcription factor [Anaerolineae bacterium]